MLESLQTEVRPWRTRANGLSLLRLALAPALAVALLGSRPFVAALLVALAIATDLADGAVARRRGETSALGGLLDHAADATFVTAGLAALVARGEVPWPLPGLVVLAFVQYVIDSRADRGARLRASVLGRWNGIAYFVPVAAVAGRDALGLAWPATSWLQALGWLLVATTLASMLDRLRTPRMRGAQTHTSPAGEKVSDRRR